MRFLLLGTAALAFVWAGSAHGAQPRFAASITRTTFGVPHIRATDWRGLGYGASYVYAQDNLCLLAEEFVTVAGERSRYFGPTSVSVQDFGKMDNLSSDVLYRSIIDLPALRRSAPSQGAAVNALIAGYVAGYNRQLRDLGAAGAPVACRGKAWLRPITVDDMLRLNDKQMQRAGAVALAAFVAGASPPGSKVSAIDPMANPFPERETALGSNGWAFGAETTTDGHGLVVGNPHFPWEGPSRFYQMHLTIPGKYDVMGVTLAGGPIVTLGFNKDVAWTHTVTAAQHFTLYQLKLDPNDPTAYLVDGKSEKMRATAITVPMPDGAAPVVRTTYSTRYGPMLVSPLIGLGWTKSQAFALRDANKGNQRGFGTWLAMGQAKNVGEVKAALERTLGIPWVNTIAADRAGNILHADVTAVPNVSQAKIDDCATPLSKALAQRLVLLDGSRSACGWTAAAGTPAPGLMPASDQAVYERRDYVANSNDSYWLSNPKAPHLVLSRILGSAEGERTLRTRSGLVEIERRLGGTDGLPGTKVDAANAKAMIFANKSLAAELAVEPMLALCAKEDDLRAACAALTGWDRRYDLDSRGAYLFTVFWDKVRNLPGLWATPFSLSDPVHTPRDLVTSGEVGSKLAAALKAAADDLAKRGIALDSRWGDVQFAVRADEHIPIHGGPGTAGVLDVQTSEAVPGGISPKSGTSYIQVVTFDANGPVADSLLSYSQSTDPASLHYADETRAFSKKEWHRAPFTPAQIAADGGAKPVRISE